MQEMTQEEILELAEGLNSVGEDQLVILKQIMPNMKPQDLRSLQSHLEKLAEEEATAIEAKIASGEAIMGEAKAIERKSVRADRTATENQQRATELERAEELLNF